jgi:hypothetical protein
VPVSIDDEKVFEFVAERCCGVSGSRLSGVGFLCNGYLNTCAHLFLPSTKKGDQWKKHTIAHIDHTLDFCLIKLEDGAYTKAQELVGSPKLNLGQRVVISGTPSLVEKLKHDSKVTTSGIISGLTSNGFALVSVRSTYGNSGGAVVDAATKTVVGILVGGAPPSGLVDAKCSGATPGQILEARLTQIETPSSSTGAAQAKPGTAIDAEFLRVREAAGGQGQTKILPYSVIATTIYTLEETAVVSSLPATAPSSPTFVLGADAGEDDPYGFSF